MSKTDNKIEIIAQASGYKNLKIEGGFRLQLDIYESRDQDIAMCALLVNRRSNLKITIEPLEEKKNV
jgi:hypothetical protein